jgi:hypothetical protein
MCPQADLFMCTLREQLSASKKRLTAAVEEWEDNEEQLKETKACLAGLWERILEIQQAYEELEQDLRFAEQAMKEGHGCEGDSGGLPAGHTRLGHERPLQTPQCGEAEQDMGDTEARSDASARDDGSDTGRDEGRKRKAYVLDNDGAADIAGIGRENAEAASGGVEGEGQDCGDGSGSDTAESGNSGPMSAAVTQLQQSGASACGAAPESFDVGPLTPATRPRREPGANRSR